VNSASGTSFHILNGIPVFIDQEYSDGAFPIAVTEHNGTVYVLNAGGSGGVVAFKADSLGGLHEVQNSSTFLTGLNSGASSISVIPNGQWLIVIEKATNSIDVFPFIPMGLSVPLSTTRGLRREFLPRCSLPMDNSSCQRTSTGSQDQVGNIVAFALRPQPGAYKRFLDLGSIFCILVGT
jgi:hypothetical protein